MIGHNFLYHIFLLAINNGVSSRVLSIFYLSIFSLIKNLCHTVNITTDNSYHVDVRVVGRGFPRVLGNHGLITTVANLLMATGRTSYSYSTDNTFT